jgi:hypothetical protein
MQLLPPQGIQAPRWPCPSNKAASLGETLCCAPFGTLRCPAGQGLSATEERTEADGSLRLVYAARISQCRPCPLREQCQWHGRATAKPRRVSVLLHPLSVGSGPLLWRDWSRRTHRRACRQLLAHQQVQIHLAPLRQAQLATSAPLLSRAQRAHYRLSWAERLARNASAPTAALVRIKLFGVPEVLTTFLGLPTS